mmetsp:Transcript_52840/g.151353  ORF Transcript_52840/g.151353 Transcript_52840/m.151353 type:complete len:207 (+) Transcript_52840:373-993(+)
MSSRLNTTQRKRRPRVRSWLAKRSAANSSLRKLGKLAPVPTTGLNTDPLPAMAVYIGKDPEALSALRSSSCDRSASHRTSRSDVPKADCKAIVSSAASALEGPLSTAKTEALSGRTRCLTIEVAVAFVSRQELAKTTATPCSEPRRRASALERAGGKRCSATKIACWLPARGRILLSVDREEKKTCPPTSRVLFTSRLAMRGGSRM